jgi:hypothetical protein
VPGREPQRVLWLLAVLFGLPSGVTRADYLYGVSEVTAEVYKYDSATGQTVGSMPILGIEGGVRNIVADGTGQLLLSGYAGGGVPIGDDQLFRLNPATGQATLVGVMTDGVKDYWVEGLAWVNGRLYGSASAIDLTNPPHYEGYAPDASNLLVTIDPTNGHVTPVGAFGPNYLNVQALAYSPKYGLIGSDIGTLNPDPNQPNGVFSTYNTTPSLIRIDPATGQSVKIADMPHGALVSNPYNSYLSPSGPYVSALTFSPDGSTLYGGTIQTHFGGTSAQILTIDPTTGGQTLVGTNDTPALLGLAFTGAAVPEPSGLALAAVGLLCAAGYSLRGR